MSDDKKPTTEEPEVEAHSVGDEVLNLQRIHLTSADGESTGFGSCSSCVGSLCM